MLKDHNKKSFIEYKKIDSIFTYCSEIKKDSIRYDLFNTNIELLANKIR